MFKNFANTIENTKKSFSCGICLNELNNPKKCPSCSFIACDNCFGVINIFYNFLIGLKKLFDSSYNKKPCPACNKLIRRSDLINIAFSKDLKEVNIIYNNCIEF